MRCLNLGVCVGFALASSLSFSQTVPGTSVTYTSTTGISVTPPTSGCTSGLTLGYGNILMTSSAQYGGAICDYNVQGSGNVVNRQGAGTLWQSAVFVFEGATSTYVNPTEAGDAYNRGSPIVQFTNSGSVQYTQSSPLGFLNQPGEDNLGGTSPSSTNVAVRFSGMQIGKELALAFNGDNNVARYLAKVSSSGSSSHVAANLPILYLPGNFKNFSTYNAHTGAWVAQSVGVGVGDVLSSDYELPGTHCGGIMAENATRTVGVALYGCKPGYNSGGARHLAFADYSYTGNPNPLATDTTALMAQIVYGDGIGLPAGLATFPTYVIVCVDPSLAGAKCVASMANLFAAGY